MVEQQFEQTLVRRKYGHVTNLLNYDQVMVLCVQNMKYDKTRTLPKLAGMVDLTSHLEKDYDVLKEGLKGLGIGITLIRRYIDISKQDFSDVMRQVNAEVV